MSASAQYIAIINAAIQAAKSADVGEAEAAAAKGGSWMSAVAKAMGHAMGIKAARMVGLSDAISKNAESMKIQLNDKDTATASYNAKQAAIGQSLNTQFQAASQEYNLVSNAFATAIKALGEGSTAIARKQ